MKIFSIFIFAFVLFNVLEQHSTKYLLVEVEDNASEEAMIFPERVTKPGQCSTPISGICVNSCTDDNECPGDLKCCYNGCGYTCIPSVPLSPNQDICMLPPVKGPCRGYSPMFYFNHALGQCIRFIYGGCRGNENKFSTKDLCEEKCGVPPGILASAFRGKKNSGEQESDEPEVSPEEPDENPEEEPEENPEPSFFSEENPEPSFFSEENPEPSVEDY